jgi:hypothetical protein
MRRLLIDVKLPVIFALLTPVEEGRIWLSVALASESGPTAMEGIAPPIRRVVAALLSR